MDRVLDISDRNLCSVGRGNLYADMVGRVEKAVIIKALQYSYGNQVEAAKILGVHRNTLHNKIKKFHIDVISFKK